MMWDELHNISAFDRMDLIIDYTAEPRKPDQREVEWDPQPIDYIVFTNPYGYQDELD
jgi:hypothetical protein